VFPQKKIVVSLIRQLSWTHIIALIPIEDTLKRDFYIQSKAKLKSKLHKAILIAQRHLAIAGEEK